MSMNETIARLTGATKRYGKLVAVDALDLEVRRGEVLAVLGPNGAGKTTSVSMLLGLTRPDAGHAELFGLEPSSPAARVRAGAMLQVSNVPETMRVREHLELFRSYYPRPLPAKEALAAANLESLADRYFGKLSGGEKQRVMFALAICGDPELVFLDEPTVGMDVETRRAFWATTRALVARGRTVVLTTHYLEEADALADRIVVIQKGTVVAQGAPHEIKSRIGARKIRCTTALPVDVVRALAGVTRADERGAVVEILSSEAERTVRELLARDASLSGLEVTAAGLEEAFLEITRRIDANEEAA
jgi:ABC-2 type transport system ATP-binding protein